MATMAQEGEGVHALKLSESLRQRVRVEAMNEEMSTNDFVALAIAEKLSRLEHDRWLKQRPNTRVSP